MASFSIGATLRQERQRQNVSLEEIARQTRISTRFLQAIEAEDFERLPGLVFTRNFVRQYADAIHVDAEPLLAELPRPNLESAPLPDPQPKVRESRWDPRWNSAIASFAWFALAVAAAIGAYVYFNRPAQIYAGKSETGQTVPAPPAAKAVENSVAPKAALPGPAVAVGPSETPGIEKAQPAQSDALAASGSAVQVLLTARETSWVQVTADGKPAFTGTMQPSDSRSVEANELVKIVAGNAGGIAISLNGKQLDPIGPSGQVRSVRLTAEGLQPLSKTPPPAPDPL